MDIMSDVHKIVPYIDDLTDAEFKEVKTKFFEIFGNDKNPAEIEVTETERFEQRVLVHCWFQNNSFDVLIQH